VVGVGTGLAGEARPKRNDVAALGTRRRGGAVSRGGGPAFNNRKLRGPDDVPDVEQSLFDLVAIALPYAAPELSSSELVLQKLDVDSNVAQVAVAFRLRHRCRSFDLLVVSHDCNPLFDCVMETLILR